MTIQEIREVILRDNINTTMSRAFRRALGLPMPNEAPKIKGVQIVSVNTFNELRECFQNASSPMDGRF